jgi:hypothetical protein
MGQALAESRDLAKFAEIVSVSGQRVMGPGTLRLWVVDRQHEELRLVQRGDHDLFGDSANAGMFLTDLDRVRLDAPDPRARAVQLAQPVEAIKGQGLRWVAKASLSERLRNGGSGWAGPVMAIDFEWLKIFGGLNKQYALLAEPMQWHHETIGVLTYERVTRPSDRFTDRDRSGLSAIAALCAAAIATRQPLALAAA